MQQNRKNIDHPKYGFAFFSLPFFKRKHMAPRTQNDEKKECFFGHAPRWWIALYLSIRMQEKLNTVKKILHAKKISRGLGRSMSGRQPAPDGTSGRGRKCCGLNTYGHGKISPNGHRRYNPAKQNQNAAWSCWKMTRFRQEIHRYHGHKQGFSISLNHIPWYAFKGVIVNSPAWKL